MKKILLPVVVFLSMCMSSCDNGMYDATPNIDKSNKVNPLGPKAHGGGVAMTATINGANWISQGGYMDIINGGLLIHAYNIPGDSTTIQKLTLNVVNYQGAGTYSLNTDGTGTWFIDSVVSTSTFGKILMDSDANGIMRGRFSFQGTDVDVENGAFRIIKN
jgi:hypothetical protein